MKKGKMNIKKGSSVGEIKRQIQYEIEIEKPIRS